jgi:hypothetical protein
MKARARALAARIVKLGRRGEWSVALGELKAENAIARREAVRLLYERLSRDEWETWCRYHPASRFHELKERGAL